MEWFDVQAGFGGFAAGGRPDFTAETLCGHLRRCNIDRALVRIVPETYETDIPLSNDKLYRACAEHESLVPCPVLAPAGDGRVGDETDQVAAAVDAGAAAAWLRPKVDQWQPFPAAADALFAALAERRLPVLLLERFFPAERLAELAGRYPDVPMIYAELSYREYRNVLAILTRFENVRISVGHNFIVHRALEDLAARVGADRLLFGTGLPACEPTAAQCMLACSELSDEQKQSVAAGNLRRLIEGIVR
jgi:predicted TIM-barrel fold metal-dependent hydrolase